MSKYREHVGRSCLYTMYERWRRLFFPKLRVHIKDNNNSPHGKFHRFLFPLSSKFPDLNFAPFVLYIYSCHETRTWHKQWAWDTRPRASPAYIKGNENQCYAGSQICESKSCIRLTGHRYSLTSEIMQCCQHGDFCFSLVLSLRIVSGWTVFICLFYILRNSQLESGVCRKRDSESLHYTSLL